METAGNKGAAEAVLSISELLEQKTSGIRCQASSASGVAAKAGDALVPNFGTSYDPALTV